MSNVRGKTFVDVDDRSPNIPTESIQRAYQSEADLRPQLAAVEHVVDRNMLPFMDDWDPQQRGKDPQGLQYLRNAAELLATDNAMLRERLCKAGSLLWLAWTEQSGWPASLRYRTEAVLNKLLARGDLASTIYAVDLQTAKWLARAILEIAFEADRGKYRQTNELGS